MKEALRVYWWSIRNAYEELFTIAAINLAWWGIGSALPTGASYLELPWLVVVLLLILVPPPTAGVYYCANRMAHDKPVSGGGCSGGQHLVLREIRGELGNLGAGALREHVTLLGHGAGILFSYAA